LLIEPGMHSKPSNEIRRLAKTPAQKMPANEFAELEAGMAQENKVTEFRAW
jgi:hypothetical protein